MSVSITPVFGLKGTGRWDTDERPTNWRQTLLKRYPRGKLPITALMSKTGREQSSSAEFHWWEEDTAMMAGAVVDVDTDDSGTALAADNTAAGSILWLEVDGTVDEPLTNYVVPGSSLYLTMSSDYRCGVAAEVLAVHRNGANSLIKVKTRQTDNSISGASLADCNYALVMPTLFPEFGGVPEVITYKPGSFYNYTSIKKEALALSRSAMKEKGIRPNDDDAGYRAMKQTALYNLGIKMEYDLIYGTRYEETDSETNQIKRGSMGLREMIDTWGVTGARTSFRYDTNYSGESWANAGWDFLKQFFLSMQQYVDFETTWHVVGAGTLLGLTDLAENNRFVSITKQEEVEFGLRIRRLLTPFGDFPLIDHPLFNRDPSLQYAWAGIPAKGLKYMYMDDIVFLSDPNYMKGGLQHVDGRFDLWMVDNGYEYHDTKGFFWLNDCGRDNAV